MLIKLKQNFNLDRKLRTLKNKRVLNFLIYSYSIINNKLVLSSTAYV